MLCGILTRMRSLATPRELRYHGEKDVEEETDARAAQRRLNYSKAHMTEFWVSKYHSHRRSGRLLLVHASSAANRSLHILHFDETRRDEKR